MNLRVFRGEPLPHVFFQPRFEPWYAWNKQFNSLPKQLSSLSLQETYDLIGASMRTVNYYTDQPDPIEYSFSGDVRISEKREGEVITRCYGTPHGSLFETLKLTTDKTWRVVEFAANDRRISISPY